MVSKTDKCTCSEHCGKAIKGLKNNKHQECQVYLWDLFSCFTFGSLARYLSKLWQQNVASQGDRGLRTHFFISLRKILFKLLLFLSVLFYLFLNPSVLTWEQRVCILLKVHSWAKNRTLASCLSAHFWTMLPQEGMFENSNFLPPYHQAVHKHMINE